MPYTSPATVASSGLITSAWGNSVKAATDYLANPPACRVYRDTTQSIAHATESVLVFNQELYDTDTMHSNTERITFTTAGLYIVSLHCDLESATDYLRSYVMIRLSGATPIAMQSHSGNGAATTFHVFSLATAYKMTAAQYIEAIVYHVNDAAAARNVQAAGNVSAHMTATWVGLG